MLTTTVSDGLDPYIVLSRLGDFVIFEATTAAPLNSLIVRAYTKPRRVLIAEAQRFDDPTFLAAVKKYVQGMLALRPDRRTSPASREPSKFDMYEYAIRFSR